MDAEDWNERYRSTDLVWGAQPNRFVEAELADLPPGRAVDVACGEGRNAVWLASKGWTVEGFDFSDAAIATARELARRHDVESSTSFAVSDALTWTTDQLVDLVAVIYLQLVRDERTTAMRRQVAAMAPGATYLFVGHDLSNLGDGYGGPQFPDVLTTPGDYAADLLAAAAKLGIDLTVERADVVTRTVETPDGNRDALDTLVRARRPA